MGYGRALERYDNTAGGMGYGRALERYDNTVGGMGYGRALERYDMRHTVRRGAFQPMQKKYTCHE